MSDNDNNHTTDKYNLVLYDSSNTSIRPPNNLSQKQVFKRIQQVIT